MTTAYYSGHSEASTLVLNGGSKSLKKTESDDSKYFGGLQQLVFEVARQSLYWMKRLTSRPQKNKAGGTTSAPRETRLA
jgi:hypothetical protein